MEILTVSWQPGPNRPVFWPHIQLYRMRMPPWLGPWGGALVRFSAALAGFRSGTGVKSLDTIKCLREE